jgi:hypothetical protein
LQGGFSTIVADIVWGVSKAKDDPDKEDLLGIDNTPNEEGDPAGDPENPWIYLDPEFDLSDPKWQLLVQRQLTSLFQSADEDSEPNPEWAYLVNTIDINPLQQCGSNSL